METLRGKERTAPEIWSRISKGGAEEKKDKENPVDKVWATGEIKKPGRGGGGKRQKKKQCSKGDSD